MKVYLKWFLGSFLLLALAGASALLDPETKDPHYAEGAIAVVAGSLGLAALFTFLELRVLPRRKEKLFDKLLHLFSAVPVTEGIVRFKVGDVDVYAETDIEIYLTAHGHYAERIRFHVPREQVARLSRRPAMSFRESACHGMQTYLVHEAGPYGLRRARRKLLEVLAPY